MSRTEQPSPPSASGVAAKIQELQLLEQSNPAQFAEALADNIMDPDPVETAAFRSDELAYFSLSGARYLIEHSNEVLKRRRRGSRAQFDTRRFQMSVGRERRILGSIVDGIRAKNGMLPNAPNPRRRAMMRLWNENMAGPVPAGRFRVLLDEETERDAQSKRDQKRLRKEAKRASGPA